MECMDAQTRINSYVDGVLPWDERKEFLDHMQKCDNCREELEIYYTLMEATRQLDEGEITTSNFKEELDHKINSELKIIWDNEERNERIRFVFILMIIIIIIWCVIQLY